MKRLGLIVLAASLLSGAFAQDLDTVTITDQFNLGPGRGNELGTGNNTTAGGLGGAKTDGSEFSDYNGSDASGVIRYINSWAGKSGGGDNPESPVVPITSAYPNKDRNQTIPAIPEANTRPGATGGNTGVVIGDDGGFNALFFGESNDSDYTVEVDLWCPGLSVGGVFTPATAFEVAGVSVRAGRDNQTSVGLGYSFNNLYSEHTYSPDRTPAYGMYYDYYKQEVRAVRWKLSNTTGEIQGRNTSASVQLGSLQNVPQGWHTMKIACRDASIVFQFDGVTIASINDSVTLLHPTNPTLTTFDYGRPCLYYREANVSNDNGAEKQGVFDNLRAGPTPPPSSINDWSVY